MRYIIVCPECGNSDIQMDKATIGRFECNKCKTNFWIYGHCGFNDERSQNRRDKIIAVPVNLRAMDVSKIPKMDVPTIPKLATGAVIPPSSEFLAILGGKKSGTNIETP